MFRQNTVFTREIRLVYGDIADQEVYSSRSPETYNFKGLASLSLCHLVTRLSFNNTQYIIIISKDFTKVFGT
jgi:hypothetical protein